MEDVPPDYEAMLKSVYQSLLSSGDNAIDAGAHLGDHTIPIARCIAPKGRVYAFEPLKECRGRLLERAKEQSRQVRKTIKLYPYALGNYCGRASYVVAVDDLAYSGLQQRDYANPTRLAEIKVKVKTIDRFFSPRKNLSYIKIDAEGGDFNIIQGARQTILRCRPVVSFECGAQAIQSYDISLSDIAEFWQACDYDLYSVTGEQLIDTQAFVDAATVQRYWDYLAVPKGRTDLIRKIHEALEPS